MSMQISHDPASGRFRTQLDQHEAELVYRLQDGRIVIDHTGVPEAIGGRGVAGALVKAALEYARAEGLRVVPACSYSASYIQRHPEYADLVDA
ncbi:MAG: GNAT family N-acetyltransferase [Pseudoxanthomonas sp.]